MVMKIVMSTENHAPSFVTSDISTIVLSEII